ncbi:unnamed protein product, partial [Mesorhabditis belari]|uniref:Sulfotransferase n=1 Tax=Mesorhabditis belari TaxID=2138241 RepID=A0AAF3EIX1_9BILA
MITQQILCDIIKDYKGISYKRGFSQKVWFLNDCKLNGNYLNITVVKWEKPNPPIKFAIIREPIERFVSFYGHFCKKLDQCEQRNIHQFAVWIDFLITNHSDPLSWSPTLINHGLPQTRFCHLTSDKSLLFVHYSQNRTQMEEELLNVFEKAKIPRDLAQKALQHLHHSSTYHASNDSDRFVFTEAVAKNPKTIAILRKLYKEDFMFWKTHL